MYEYVQIKINQRNRYSLSLQFCCSCIVYMYRIEGVCKLRVGLKLFTMNTDIYEFLVSGDKKFHFFSDFSSQDLPIAHMEENIKIIMNYHVQKTFSLCKEIMKPGFNMSVQVNGQTLISPIVVRVAVLFSYVILKLTIHQNLLILRYS